MYSFARNLHKKTAVHYIKTVKNIRVNGNHNCNQSEHRPQYMVSDLLIQSRGRKRNYLAVEMKRKGNYRNAKDDRERLASMVSPAPHGMHDRCVHDTLVGAFIIYGKEGVKIELFENVNGRGENTETIEIFQ